MARSKSIYEERGRLIAKYSHPKSDEYLSYDATIRIRDSGKSPVEMTLKFDGIHPFLAPMPPEDHSIKAASVAELYSKVGKWFRKHGYDVK